jgi:hypothetical protein
MFNRKKLAVFLKKKPVSSKNKPMAKFNRPELNNFLAGVTQSRCKIPISSSSLASQCLTSECRPAGKNESKLKGALMF